MWTLRAWSVGLNPSSTLSSALMSSTKLGMLSWSASRKLLTHVFTLQKPNNGVMVLFWWKVSPLGSLYHGVYRSTAPLGWFVKSGHQSPTKNMWWTPLWHTSRTSVFYSHVECGQATCFMRRIESRISLGETANQTLGAWCPTHRVAIVFSSITVQ